ncbi:MAG TPA: thioredoxin [Gammaproteobacteria bacterium]|nr:thioredoxin [Gammaproteobacteria bacterium]
MKHGFARFVLALLSGLLAFAVSAREQEPRPAWDHPGYHEPPAWFKTSFLDIGEDVNEATATGKRLVLYFYQDGCPYCARLLDVNFAQRDIAERMQRYFDVVAINIWGSAEVTDLEGRETTEKDFAAALDVDFTPTLLFLDEQGKVVVRLNGYYPPHKLSAVIDYVGQKKEKDLSFRAFWMKRAPAPSSGRLHDEPGWLKPPYRLDARDSGRPLLVLFEQRDCAPCDELHQDVLAREESRKLLEGFDVALFDIWSATTRLTTPDGRATTARDWAKSLNIQYVPSMLMFDVSGREVFRTEAYLRTFHVQSALDYVLSGAYRKEPNFQRFLQARADALEARGVHVEIMD